VKAGEIAADDHKQLKSATLGLSRNTKSSLDIFRELGNFSAHKIEYICRREYIQPIFKHTEPLTELLHKSGIRT